MKPPRFKYGSAASVEEAVSLLSEHGADASVLAGGQSLVPMLNMRLARPEVLVDIGRVTELDYISANGDLAIGAMTRQATALASEQVATKAPLLRKALPWIAHAGIRTRGTVGGSAAHGDPASEIPAVLVALEGDIVVRGAAGERVIPAEQFFLSSFVTAKADDELLTEVRISSPAEGSRSAFIEVSRRHGDYALVGVAAQLLVDDGFVESARICLLNVADTPFLAAGTAAALVGREFADPAVLDEASKAVLEGLTPSSDAHASAEYRREVSVAMVRRALEQIKAGGN
jgi:carbon-monoxide dehydrogenase medium subunit